MREYKLYKKLSEKLAAPWDRPMSTLNLIEDIENELKEVDELELPKKPLRLLDSMVHFNVEELARQMTLIDAKLFKAIRVSRLCLILVLIC